MLIRTKKDAANCISRFSSWSTFDVLEKKHYIVVNDKVRTGQWTLMQYADGLFTLHGRGGSYCDHGETVLRDNEPTNFVWKHRKEINLMLKNLNVQFT